MTNKNNFLLNYLHIPDKVGIRRFVRAILILTNFFNYGIIFLFHKAVLDKPISHLTLVLFVIIISVFDSWSLIMLIFPVKFSKLFYLYTSTAFVGSSFLYFYIANIIFYHELDNIFFAVVTGISILIFFVIIISVIINVRNKIRKKFTKKYNKQFAGIITGLCIPIGIILAKQTNFGNIYFAIMLLILSYSLAFTISGFHKFYLILKK